jgi:hypothetical protein
MFKDCVGHLPTDSNTVCQAPISLILWDKKKARDNLHVTLAKNPQESVLFSHKLEQGQTVFCGGRGISVITIS